MKDKIESLKSNNELNIIYSGIKDGSIKVHTIKQF